MNIWIEWIYLELLTNTLIFSLQWTEVCCIIGLVRHFGGKQLQELERTWWQKLDEVRVQRILILFQKAICVIQNLIRFQMLLNSYMHYGCIKEQKGNSFILNVARIRWKTVKSIPPPKLILTCLLQELQIGTQQFLMGWS